MKTENIENERRAMQIITISNIKTFANPPIFNIFVLTKNCLSMKIEETYPSYTPPCPCCCSAYMEEHDTYWVCPVCGAIVDKR